MPDAPHCLRCNKAVEAAWQICPYCEAVLKGHARGSRGGIAHDLLVWAEARVDRVWVYVVAAIGAAIVLFCGIMVAPMAGGEMLGGGGIFLALMLVVSGLALVIVVFNLTRHTYRGRFLKTGLLVLLFLVGSLALLAFGVSIVVMLTMR